MVPELHPNRKISDRRQRTRQIQTWRLVVLSMSKSNGQHRQNRHENKIGEIPGNLQQFPTSFP